MAEWLEWLRWEIAVWYGEPSLVQAVVTVINNQNEDIGYSAEDELSRLLLHRFPTIPWLHP